MKAFRAVVAAAAVAVAAVEGSAAAVEAEE
jgi:hypothetical protein